MLQDISISNQKNLSVNEKNIYNTFLATSRSVKDQPFKFRENFDNIELEKMVALRKLSIFFNKYPHINMRDFFIAPYKLYNTQDYYDLNFYNTRKAIVCYTNYVKNKETEQPDSDEVIESCKESLKYIFKYCKNNKITFNKYKNHKLEGDTMPVWLVHLKEHYINFYTLHAIGIDKEINRIEADLLNFYVTDFYSLLHKTRTKYVTSCKLKSSMQSCIKVIEQNLLIFEN